ncbi:GNAT family N-acetyltransferase [Kitasatospora sp. NPDC056783]|uniref:GNAT family N-acetyltransferase n=1 Tax=Kitasatospora sp. NPDC056783 TaxID=3345943 RepID=UPI0036994BB0
MPSFVEFEAFGDKSPEHRNTPISVRHATVADVERCADLARQYEGDDAGAVDFESRVRGWLNRPAGCFLVAVGADHDLVGYGRVVRLEAATAPTGFYLAGLVVDPGVRRRGVGLSLTRSRMEWISANAPEAWYFCNARNHASIELHAGMGFHEMTRDFEIPGVTFEGGVGILFHKILNGARCSCPQGQ